MSYVRCALILSLIATCTSFSSAAELHHHYRSPLVDAYLDSSTVQPPDIPGFSSKPEHRLAISVRTDDLTCTSFAVYVMVRLEDGTRIVRKRVISYKKDQIAVTIFFLGHLQPVEVIAFDVMRLKPEPVESFIIIPD